MKKRSQNHFLSHYFTSKIPYSFDTRGILSTPGCGAHGRLKTTTGKAIILLLPTGWHLILFPSPQRVYGRSYVITKFSRMDTMDSGCYWRFARESSANLFFWKWPGTYKNVLFFGRGMTLFFYPLLKRQWTERLFCQIFITVLTSWKARIFFTTQQTSCISWSLINTITPVIPWCIPDFVPSFHFALRYCCFVAITLYSPYPQWANHTPKRCVAKNPFSSRIP